MFLKSPQSLINFHLSKAVSPVLKTSFTSLYTHLPSLTRKPKAQEAISSYLSSQLSCILALSFYMKPDLGPRLGLPLHGVEMETAGHRAQRTGGPVSWVKTKQTWLESNQVP